MLACRWGVLLPPSDQEIEGASAAYAADVAAAAAAEATSAVATANEGSATAQDVSQGQQRQPDRRLQKGQLPVVLNVVPLPDDLGTEDLKLTFGAAGAVVVPHSFLYPTYPSALFARFHYTLLLM